MTIEGLKRADGTLHLLQQTFFIGHFSLQCGGFLTTLVELPNDNPDPSELRVALSDNLCHCTGYQNIVVAAIEAAKKILLECSE